MVTYRDGAYGRDTKRSGLWSVIRRDPAARQTGTLLLGIVVLFILADVVLRLFYNSDGSVSPLVHLVYMNISIGRDNTIAEIFNHGMAFSAAILFFTAFAATRSRVCLALAGFMGIAWFDDAAQFHERVGRAFGERFPDVKAFGVGAIHIGELVAWAAIGFVVLMLILWSSRRVLPGDRLVLQLVIPPVLLLIACAVIVDVIHVPFAGTNLDAAFMYLEDGGEMIAIALVTTIALYVVRNVDTVFGRA